MLMIWCDNCGWDGTEDQLIPRSPPLCPDCRGNIRVKGAPTPGFPDRA